IRRAHRNDLESILPFLVVGYLAASSGAVGYGAASWLFGAFTGARIVHTVMYAFGLQPWRSIFFAIADVALLATTVLLLAAAL
ncbi:MAG: MAPEG family protein, partial [Candidatus Binatia bacterium]